MHNVAFLRTAQRGGPKRGHTWTFLNLLYDHAVLNPRGVGHHLEGFGTELDSLGYALLTIEEFLTSATHFCVWLEACGLSFAEVGQTDCCGVWISSLQLSGEQKAEACLATLHDRRVQRFVVYLRKQGAISAITNSRPDDPYPLISFRDWLLSRRGLAGRTVDRHLRLVTQMLPALGTNSATYNAASVRRVILAQIRGCRPANAKTMVGALRVYLRFLATSGLCQAGLDHALPCVAEWRLSSLPRYLNAAQAYCLIDSCEKNGPQGLRDRAIVLLLIRLGLRAGDIAGMCLGDIDWREATLLVRGKGRRDVCLPLPQDAGDAVLDYMEGARPQIPIDRVFLCTRAPFRPLESRSIVSGIVRAALKRAGIKTAPTYGANLLRHTAATMMLRGGATLHEIGTVLRHKSPDTTAHYAKVDVAALQQIAQPWPNEEGKC
jgi:integrase/recombinase XerD